MNGRKLQSVLLLAGLTLALATQGFSATLFEDDFSGSTTGVNESFGAWDAAGLSVFAGTFSSTPATAAPSWRQDNSLRFVYSTFNQVYQWKTNSANSFSSTDYTVKADALQSSGGAESMKIVGFGHASNPDGSIDTDTGYFVNWYETAGGADYIFVDKYVDGTSEISSLVTTNHVTQGTYWLGFNKWNTMEIEVLIDSDTGEVTFDIYMTPQDGARTLAASTVDSSGIIDGAGMSLTAYSRNSSPNYAGITYFDSVLATGVPEPATFSLLAIGCMGLITRKKKM